MKDIMTNRQVDLQTESIVTATMQAPQAIAQSITTAISVMLTMLVYRLWTKLYSHSGWLNKVLLNQTKRHKQITKQTHFTDLVASATQAMAVEAPLHPHQCQRRRQGGCRRRRTR